MVARASRQGAGSSWRRRYDAAVQHGGAREQADDALGIAGFRQALGEDGEQEEPARPRDEADIVGDAAERPGLGAPTDPRIGGDAAPDAARILLFSSRARIRAFDATEAAPPSRIASSTRR